VTLSAVVVGTGIGCQTHVHALRGAGFGVVALVGRDAARTAERAARVGIPNAFTALAEALARTDVDAVVVATPPNTHAELVLEAVAAGKHVVCEKPFAQDRNEALRMLAAAEEAGVVHLVGTEYRWGAAQGLATRAIAGGVVGTPRLATFLLFGGFLAGPDAGVPEWWGAADQGGGWLQAHAPHLIDQVRSSLGEFEGVSAGLPRVAEHEWAAEDSFSVRFRLTNGVEGVMHESACDWGPPMFMTRVAGTSGTLWVEGGAVYVADAEGTRQLPVPDDLAALPFDPPPMDLLVSDYDRMRSGAGEIPPFTRLYKTFGDLINGTPVPSDPRPGTFADGVAAMAVIDAIRQSAAAGGEWVAVAGD
jgi:predicted dehydrogenase